MTDLMPQEQLNKDENKDENKDKSTEMFDEYDDTSPGSNAETVMITILAIITMGILIVMFI